jgi:hypothetical protein
MRRVHILYMYITVSLQLHREIFCGGVPPDTPGEAVIEFLATAMQQVGLTTCKCTSNTTTHMTCFLLLLDNSSIAVLLVLLTA